MIKKILTLIFVAIGLPVFSQITLNSNNFPVGGLMVNRGYCFSSGTVLGSPGGNQFYDFTSIIPVYHDTIKYYPAAQTPWAAFHPGAGVATATSANGLITVDYFTASGTAYRRTGQTLIGNLGGGMDTIHANFAPEDTLLSNNFTYGTLKNSRTKAIFYNFIAFANLERTTLRSIYFDGWGSLQTPLNYYSDVLRVKGAEAHYDTAFYFGSPVYTAADTVYFYKYYAKDVRHPVVTAHTDKNFSLQYFEYIFSPPVITGCTDTMAVNYNPLANYSDGNCEYCNVSYTVTPDTIICAGSTVNLAVSGGSSYLWQDGSTSSGITVTPAQSATYSVYVSSSQNCHALATINITVDEPVTATFWTSQDTYHAGETVQFINLSENASQYSWDFDDPPSGNSNQQYPVYTFATPGLRNIALIASNSCYSDSTTEQINIIGPSTVQHDAAAGALRLYPNPGTDRIIIDGLPASTSFCEIFAIDMTGRYKRISEHENISARTPASADVSSLPEGMYIIEIRTENNVSRFKWLKIK